MVVDHGSGKLYIVFGTGSQFGYSNMGDIHEFDIRTFKSHLQIQLGFMVSVIQNDCSRY